MAKDLYAVLGLGRSASAQDIKKAYRTLSKEWHPDKHKGDKAAEERFKEINEAYEVLTDERKKAMYDQFGQVGGAGGHGQGFGGFDPGDFAGGFGDIGSIFESFFGGGARRGTRQEKHGSDRELELDVPLAGAVTGSRRTFQFRHEVACAACKGQGAAEGSAPVTCTACKGTGQVNKVTQSFFGMLRQTSVCAACSGSGKVPEKVCSHCRGEGRREENDEVMVEIPAGIEDGQSLRIRGRGDAGRRGAAAGDLFVRIRVRPDPRFERRGNDIHSVLTATVLDAILGAELPVETVHGRTHVKLEAGTQPGDTLRLRSKGMPILGSARTGDHYITVRIEIPRKLSREERRLLEEWRKLH